MFEATIMTHPSEFPDEERWWEKHKIVVWWKHGGEIGEDFACGDTPEEVVEFMRNRSWVDREDSQEYMSGVQSRVLGRENFLFHDEESFLFGLIKIGKLHIQKWEWEPENGSDSKGPPSESDDFIYSLILPSNMNWSKNLYIFMLSAVIVMSGCMGVGTTDGEDENTPNSPLTNNQTNEPPVAYWTIGKEDEQRSTWNESTGEEYSYHYTTIGWHLSAIDFDGNISAVGVDFDLDGIIEYPFISNDWGNFSYHEGPVNLTYADADLVPSDSYCYWRMNLIVIDDDGASFVEPITITGTTMSKCEEERAGLSS